MDLSAWTRPVERLVATAQNGLEVLRYGGLETGAVPSPFQIVESVPMYKLRRYFPPDNRPGQPPAGPPVLMVHPMMMSADMWDVTREDGAVGILHAAGIDPVGHRLRLTRQGRGRHATATWPTTSSRSARPSTRSRSATGRDVHLAGYSQGGMFAYQTAAYRRSKDLASIVAFGSPVDTLAALPMGMPAEPGARGRRFHGRSRLQPASTSQAGWRAPVSRCSTRSRPPRRGVDFLRQLHDREALLPREQQRRFLESRRLDRLVRSRRSPSCSSSSSRTTG